MKKNIINDNIKPIKSIGGYNSKFFYFESLVIMIAILFLNRNESFLNLLMWLTGSILIIVIQSSKWLNGIDFYENKLVLINRQFFRVKKNEINYIDIKKVVYKNFSYTSPSYLKVEFENRNEYKTLTVPYNHIKDKSLVIELFKKYNIPFEVKGYQI